MRSRRDFLARLLGSALGEKGALREPPHFKLSELGQLPTDRLARLVPRLERQLVRIEDERIVRLVDSETVCTLAPFEQAALELVDGESSVERIAGALYLEHQVDVDEAIEATRALVVALVEAGVCFPVNAV